jgi:hypothetical protein
MLRWPAANLSTGTVDTRPGRRRISFWLRGDVGGAQGCGARRGARPRQGNRRRRIASAQERCETCGSAALRSRPNALMKRGGGSAAIGEARDRIARLTRGPSASRGLSLLRAPLRGRAGPRRPRCWPWFTARSRHAVVLLPCQHWFCTPTVHSIRLAGVGTSRTP